MHCRRCTICASPIVIDSCMGSKKIFFFIHRTLVLRMSSSSWVVRAVLHCPRCTKNFSYGIIWSNLQCASAVTFRQIRPFSSPSRINLALFLLWVVGLEVGLGQPEAHQTRPTSDQISSSSQNHSNRAQTKKIRSVLLSDRAWAYF